MRFATVEDFGLIEIMLRSYLAEQEAVGSPLRFTRRTLDWYRDLIWSYLEGKESGAIVLGEVSSEAGEEVAGFAMGGESPGESPVDLSIGRMAQVWVVWVTPEHRRSGLALSMLRFGQPRLVEMGFETAVMSSRAANQQGNALCRSFGAFNVENFYQFSLGEKSNGTGR